MGRRDGTWVRVRANPSPYPKPNNPNPNPNPNRGQARRRKLTLAQEDVVAQVEPKYSFRLTTELLLSPPAAGEPPHYL